MKKPMISVIMAVHNEEEHLSEAIQSILDQTYSDFEFIIIDDASTDRSPEIIKDFSAKDSRIRILTNEETIRLPGSLNRGIEVANGEWIARMDGDDISLPTRLAVQMEYLDTNPDIDILSTWILRIAPDGKKITEWRMSEIHSIILWRILFSTPVYHGTAFIRKSALMQYGMYDDTAILEDLDLWTRLAPFVKFGCVPKALYKYRDSVEDREEKAITRVPIANEIRIKFIEELVEFDVTQESFDDFLLSSFSNPLKQISWVQAINAVSLLLRINAAFRARSMILEEETETVSQFLADRISNLMRHADSEHFEQWIPNYKKIGYWRQSGLPRPIKWSLFLLLAPKHFFELVIGKLGPPR